MNKSDSDESDGCRKDAGCVYILCCIVLFLSGFSIFAIYTSITPSCDKWNTKYPDYNCIEMEIIYNDHCNSTALCSCTKYSDHTDDTICIDTLATNYDKTGLTFGCIFAVIAFCIIIEPVYLLVKYIYYRIRSLRHKYQTHCDEKVRLMQLYKN